MEIVKSGKKGNQVLVKTSKGLKIRTLEGDMLVNPGDYIVRGTHNEWYPVRKDIFEENYEEVEGEDDV